MTVSNIFFNPFVDDLCRCCTLALVVYWGDRAVRWLINEYRQNSAIQKADDLGQACLPPLVRSEAASAPLLSLLASSEFVGATEYSQNSATQKADDLGQACLPPLVRSEVVSAPLSLLASSKFVGATVHNRTEGLATISFRKTDKGISEYTVAFTSTTIKHQLHNPREITLSLVDELGLYLKLDYIDEEGKSDDWYFQGTVDGGERCLIN